MSRAQIVFTSVRVQFSQSATFQVQDLKLRVSSSELTVGILLLQANLEPNSHMAIPLPFHFLGTLTSFWIHFIPCRGWTPGSDSVGLPASSAFSGSLQPLTFPFTISGCRAWLCSYNISWVLSATQNPFFGCLFQYSPLRLT